MVSLHTFLRHYPPHSTQPQRQFLSRTFGIIRSECKERAALVYQLYTKGLTTEQISEVIETVYSRAYRKQQISYLANSYREDVEAWLNRRLSAHYLAIYIDATFIATRRDQQVSKEAYYTILGVLEDESREVLTIVNYPTEGALISIGICCNGRNTDYISKESLSMEMLERE